MTRLSLARTQQGKSTESCIRPLLNNQTFPPSLKTTHTSNSGMHSVFNQPLHFPDAMLDQCSNLHLLTYSPYLLDQQRVRQRLSTIIIIVVLICPNIKKRLIYTFSETKTTYCSALRTGRPAVVVLLAGVHLSPTLVKSLKAFGIGVVRYV